MISYIKRTKWKKLKKHYQKEKENYRFDDENGYVIVTQYYYRDRLNPENHVGEVTEMVCDSQDTTYR